MTTSLEKRIADALAAVPMISSGDLAKLYSEVEVASAEADAAAKKAKDAAIDVVRSSDGRAARAAMEEAALTNDRLQNSLPRLRARMLEVLDAERTKAWLAEYGELKVQRDAVAKRFDEDLPRLCLELVAIMEAVKNMNAAVSNLNIKAPSIAGYHLDRVDEERLVDKLVLPALKRGQPDLWPKRDAAAFAALFQPAPFDARFSPLWPEVAAEKQRQLIKLAEENANR